MGLTTQALSGKVPIKIFRRKKVHERRRGTIIYETERGVLVTSGHKKVFLLPGGGAESHESRRRAAIRELREETSLVAHRVRFLFRHKGKINRSHHGGLFQDHHSVFLATSVSGHARPCHEIAHVAFYQKGNSVHVSRTTEEIIERYLKQYKHMSFGSRIAVLFNRVADYFGL